MNSKNSKAIFLILGLYICGVISTYIGFFKGAEIAIMLSKPKFETGWTTSGEFINNCTYFPVMLGAPLIFLAIMLSAILFSKWVNSDKG